MSELTGAGFKQTAMVATPSPSGVAVASGSETRSADEPAVATGPMATGKSPVIVTTDDAAPVSAVKHAAEQIDSYLKSIGRSLEFHVDDDTGQVVVLVKDATTGQLVRQMPSEEALRIARALGNGTSALIDLSA